MTALAVVGLATAWPKQPRAALRHVANPAPSREELRSAHGRGRAKHRRSAAELADGGRWWRVERGQWARLEQRALAALEARGVTVEMLQPVYGVGDGELLGIGVQTEAGWRVGWLGQPRRRRAALLRAAGDLVRSLDSPTVSSRATSLRWDVVDSVKEPTRAAATRARSRANRISVQEVG